GGHRPLHADSVAAHDRVHPLAGGVEHGHVKRLGELVADLEDVPDLDGRQYLHRVTAPDAGLPGADLAQAGPGPDGNGAADVHAAQVDVVGVGPGDHVAPAAERLVRG